jgi:serine protease Do
VENAFAHGPEQGPGEAPSRRVKIPFPLGEEAQGSDAVAAAQREIAAEIEPRGNLEGQIMIGSCAAILALLVLVGLPAPGAAESLGEMFRRVNPSVVVIRAKGKEVQTQGVVSFGEIGSGVLVSPDGKVVTAAHVVHTMEEITVEVLGEDPVPARVIASEPGADLSVLQLDTVPRDAVVAKLADSNLSQVGDHVFIIGAPYGLSHSLSTGILSARWDANTVNRDFPLAEFFQTDAPINTGNSGGPMFNMAGEVIGIVSHIISKSGGSEGLGFVVTTDSVKRLVLERRPLWHGVDGQLVTGTTAMLLNLPQPGGLLVKDVVKGSLGERMGIKGGNRLATLEGQQVVVGGDVILSVQGVPVISAEDRLKIRAILQQVEPGQDFRVTVLRAGRLVDLSITWPSRERGSVAPQQPPRGSPRRRRRPHPGARLTSITR